MKGMGKLKSADFFRKLPSDLTEATLTGASLSMVASVIMMFLLVMEFSSFMATKTETKVVVDRSPMNDLLRINFNISFTKMTCEHLTLDVSDQLGSKKINLSKTVRKTPVSSDLSQKGSYMRDESIPMPQYDEHTEDTVANTKYVEPLNTREVELAKARYPLLVINYYAPWCPFCQRLGPTWANVSEWAHTKYPVTDGRIRLASVDCTKEDVLCNKEYVTAFPSIRVYRRGSDRVVSGGMLQHEAYHGDRTADALEKFVDNLIAGYDAGAVGRTPGTRKMTLAEGCQMSGFVLVKKVPGSLHFHMRQSGLSFETEDIDVSHVVHSYTFGNRPSPKRLRTLSRLHPGGLNKDWADKLQGLTFLSNQPEFSHEHYLQLIRFTLEPTRGKPYSSYDAYEYTVHSHSYKAENLAALSLPVAKFSYHPSPMQVLVQEQRRHWYHFLTTTCAIIGGVFTVCGILDGLSFNAYKVMKKVELGKQT